MSENRPEILLPLAGEPVFARFVKRERRFLVEVENASGRFTVHANNTGSMLGLLRPGARVVLSTSDNPRRKLAHTLEMVEVPDFRGPFWVGVNTLAPNRLLRAAFARGLMPELAGYDVFLPEPRFSGGRLDARLTGAAGELFIETKNVTMVEDGAAQFPDAPSERARKHLRELIRLAGLGGGVRAACLFLVQRPDGDCFAPAECVDPEYAALFWEALAAGVAMRPWRASVGPKGLGLGGLLPLAPAPLRSGRSDGDAA